MTTPNAIDVILHYYTTSGPHPRIDAPAVQTAIVQFTDKGLLEKMEKEGSGGYSVTRKGRAWIAMLLQTPYPEQTWVDPRSSETIKDHNGTII